MSRIPKEIRTSELVKIVKKVGFVERHSNGMHTIFDHPDGAVITIPTGRKETPKIFIKAIISQLKYRDEIVSKELEKLLEK